MSDSTGIVLAATAISFTNKWASTNNIDLSIPIAGGFVALLFSGIEQVSKPAGVGLAWLMMISVVLSPPKGGTAPPLTVLSWVQPQKTAITPWTVRPVNAPAGGH